MDEWNDKIRNEFIRGRVKVFHNEDVKKESKGFRDNRQNKTGKSVNQRIYALTIPEYFISIPLTRNTGGNTFIMYLFLLNTVSMKNKSRKYKITHNF